MTEYILYHTSACHLCEQAQTLIAQCGYAVPSADIVTDPVLVRRYGTRIPVLVRISGGAKDAPESPPTAADELDWPFDSEDLLAFFARNSGAKASPA